jgi:transcriptional regulator with XRE-family HTH domain
MGAVQSAKLPKEFWERGDVADALDRSDIGTVLRLVLDELDLSQYALAAMAGATQAQVSQWMRHLRAPRLDTVARLADKLAMPACARRRLGLSALDIEIGEGEVSQVKLHRVLALAEQIGRSGKIGDLDSWRDAVKPRGSMEPWHDLSQLIAAPRPPGQLHAETMAPRIRGLYLLAARIPARIVIRALTAHIHDVTLLLSAVDDRRLRRDLTVNGGESAYLAACCEVDLGDFAAALDLLDTCSDAAAAGSDSALAAIALDGQSHFQAAQGHHNRALELVSQALSACPASVSEGTVAYLWLHMAEELACLGRTANALEAWRNAEEHYHRSDLATDRPWLQLWLTRTCFESVKAVICASTRRPKEAADVAVRVVTRLRGRDGKIDAICLLNAAIALGRVGLYRQAAVGGRHALYAMRAADARGCLARAGEVAAMLRSAADEESEVAAFLHDLDYTRTMLAPDMVIPRPR